MVVQLRLKCLMVRVYFKVEVGRVRVGYLCVDAVRLFCDLFVCRGCCVIAFGMPRNAGCF